jgi:hypothetical protein
MAEFVKLKRVRINSHTTGGTAYLRPTEVSAVTVLPGVANIYVGPLEIQIEREEWDQRAKEILGQDP